MEKTAQIADEEAAARALLRMLALCRRYPSGKMPLLGVTMCREWLLEHYSEDSFESRLLNLVEVHADDEGWSLDGVPQGAPWTLIGWILDDMSPQEADDVEHALMDYHQEIGTLVLEAYERRTGKKFFHEKHQRVEMKPRNSKGLAARAHDSNADQNEKNPPGPRPEPGRRPLVNPDLLHRIAQRCEESRAREVLKSYALARLYPSGMLPPWGVTMCREWLREDLNEDHPTIRLLNLVQIDDDDQGWSLNGVWQGGVWDLVEFMLGPLAPNVAEEVYTDMMVDYMLLGWGLKHAAERRTALGLP